MRPKKSETLKIDCGITKRGIRLHTRKGSFGLDYPVEIWQAYPGKDKEILVDNLLHILTVDIPFVSNIRKIEYNRPLPFFRPFIYHLIMDNIPSAIDDPSGDAVDKIKDFFNTSYSFSDYDIKMPGLKYRPKNRAIIPFSLGKDSLLTLALARETGLDPVCVYINDTVSPSENKIKLQFAGRLSKEFGIKFYAVTNNIEKLNDFEFWNTDESCLGYMHMIMGFCMVLLPFAYYEKAKYIMLGNQQNMNFGFKDRDGFWTYPAPDQGSEWTRLHSAMTGTFTSRATSVYSLIEPLTDIAIVKILHSRYPELAKYQVSCNCLDASDEKRWCNSCSECARLFLFMKASGIDPERAGLHKNLFNKRYRRYFSLFGGKATEEQEHSRQAKDEQLLAFYMAAEKGATGYLIDKFKRLYLKEARRRKKKLFKQFFSLYPAHLPKEVSGKLNRIYKDELEQPNLGTVPKVPPSSTNLSTKNRK